MFIDCPSVCVCVLTCVVRASLPGRRHSPAGFPSRGGSRGVTRVTSHPPGAAAISCYYYACDLSYFDVVLCPSSSQIQLFHLEIIHALKQFIHF